MWASALVKVLLRHHGSAPYWPTRRIERASTVGDVLAHGSGLHGHLRHVVLDYVTN